MDKVYFFGSSDGKLVKIGFTADPLRKRRLAQSQGQMSDIQLLLLAAVRGTKTHEREVQRYFNLFAAKVNSTETFYASPELVEYINWLRQQWYTCLDEDDAMDQIVEATQWMPTNERRVGFMEEDGTELFPRHVSYTGSLAGTPWNKLCTPSKTGDDFYTPAEIVSAASEAMGGIDLDACSHWQANRVHKIPLYYHIHRSAIDNPWFGRVWLNPPYGNNAPWFDRISTFWGSGDIKQLCMISPVWVFTTQIARPIMKRSSAMILLSPTPEFWGHPNGRTGTNHPHAVIYMGNRVREFHEAFAKYGIPFRLDFTADNYGWHEEEARANAV